MSLSSFFFFFEVYFRKRLKYNTLTDLRFHPRISFESANIPTASQPHLHISSSLLENLDVFLLDNYVVDLLRTLATIRKFQVSNGSRRHFW